MERPEPKKGDPLIDRGYRTTIYRFDEDRGTGLYNGTWVCISEFEKGKDGVWRRSEPHGLTGLVDLERPVGESAPDDLTEAALLIRQHPTRFTQFYGTAELLAAVFDCFRNEDSPYLEIVAAVVDRQQYTGYGLGRSHEIRHIYLAKEVRF